MIRKLQIKTCNELDRHRRRHRENNMKSGVPTFLFGILLLRTGDAKGELHRIIYLRARKHHQQQQQARKQPSTTSSTKAQEPRKDRIAALPIRSTSSSTSMIAAIIIIVIIIYSSCSTIIAVYPRSFHALIATITRGGRTLSAQTATRIATRTRARCRLCLCLI